MVLVHFSPATCILFKNYVDGNSDPDTSRIKFTWIVGGKAIVKNISIHIGDLVYWHLVMPDRDLAS